VKPDSLRVIEWPSVEPVTVTEAKQQLGMMPEQTEWDSFLLDKLGAARELVESRLGITCVATKWRATWYEAQRILTLPRPPVLVSVDYPISVTVGGDALVRDTDYVLEEDARPAFLELTAGHSGRAVVEFWAGVEPGQQISRKVKAAILLYVTHQFENRGVLAAASSAELPQAFETLLAAESHSGGW
jgi:uncharacterized phiE125 gp8 family phage protein